LTVELRWLSKSAEVVQIGVREGSRTARRMRDGFPRQAKRVNGMIGQPEGHSRDFQGRVSLTFLK
jgi:hypothetical protein